MDIEKMYGAYIKFPQVAGDIEFNYSEMEIVKKYKDMVELKHPCFTSHHYSTHYFEKDMLDREYKITDSLTCYYSESKEKCIEWLKNKRNDLIKCYEYDYKRLVKSEVKEVVESE